MSTSFLGFLLDTLAWSSTTARHEINIQCRSWQSQITLDDKYGPESHPEAMVNHGPESHSNHMVIAALRIVTHTGDIRRTCNELTQKTVASVHSRSMHTESWSSRSKCLHGNGFTSMAHRATSRNLRAPTMAYFPHSMVQRNQRDSHSGCPCCFAASECCQAMAPEATNATLKI